MSGKLDLLTPQNSQLIFIDQQPQMAFGVQSMDRQALKNNVVALAKSVQVWKQLLVKGRKKRAKEEAKRRAAISPPRK